MLCILTFPSHDDDDNEDNNDTRLNLTCVVPGVQSLLKVSFLSPPEREYCALFYFIT